MKVFVTLDPSLKRNLGVMFVAGLCFWAGLAGLLPTLPLYIEQFGANGQQIGWVMASFAVGLLIMRPIMARMTDEQGRKPVLLIGLVSIAIAPLLYWLVPFFPEATWQFSVGSHLWRINSAILLMMIFRAFHGLSIASFVTAYSALVADIAPPEQRGELIGYMSLVNPIGMAVGPALGGYLPVDADGFVSLPNLEKAIRPDTILVSVMAANNEIGVLQPLQEIGALCQEREILFHSDAAQAVGKVPLDVQTMNIHLMSMTAHKLYGPKGIGALYVRRRQPRVNLAAQLHGGGHERGMRSGTLYPPQIVGFAKAIELAVGEMVEEGNRLAGLRSHLLNQLNQLSDIHINGHPSQRLPGNLNISFGSVDGQSLMLGLQPVVALSSGSACSSASTAPSHVLKALGRSDQLAHASLRFGLGRFTTPHDIQQVGQAVIETVETLRAL